MKHANEPLLPYFHKCTKLAPRDVGKCEIIYQWVQEDYISGLQSSLVQLVSNGAAKMNLEILAFLFCGELVKNSNVGAS